MLAYVIIAIELAILYTVFWYVFLREPQPYKIKGNPWGGYSGSGSAPQPPAFANPQTSFVQPAASPCEANRNAIYQEWNVPTCGRPTQDLPCDSDHNELIRSQRMGIEKSAFPADKSKRSSTFAAQFLAKLGESLNLINVKIP